MCKFKSCNILRNAQVHIGSYGTFYTTGNMRIENSCILDNKAHYIFYQSSSSYTITVSNCILDNIIYNQNLLIQNTVMKSFILSLDHMSTRNCHSEYGSAGILTHVGQPSPSSSSKKQIHICAYEKFLYQSRLRNFVSLI